MSEEIRAPGSRSDAEGDLEAPGAANEATGRGNLPREADGDVLGTCELCGGPTVERHCKIVCRRCGYRRDCSDP